MSRVRNDQRRDDWERRRRGIGRDDDAAGSLGAPAHAAIDPPSLALGRLLFTSAPKWSSIFSVWSRDASASTTVVTPRALRPASSTADLICAEGTGVRYRMGAGSRAPFQHDRAAPALGLAENLGSHQAQRIEYAAHWAVLQGGVAVEDRRDAVAADDAHHQPRAGAGVTEVKRPAGRHERAEAWAPDPPAAGPKSLDRRAQSFGRPCRSSARLRPEEALDPRLTAGQEAENKGAVGDRLVAWRSEAPLERHSPDRAQGAGTSRVGIRGNGHAATRIFSLAPLGAAPRSYHRA